MHSDVFRPQIAQISADFFKKETLSAEIWAICGRKKQNMNPTKSGWYIQKN